MWDVRVSCLHTCWSIGWLLARSQESENAHTHSNLSLSCCSSFGRLDLDNVTDIHIHIHTFACTKGKTHDGRDQSASLDDTR